MEDKLVTAKPRRPVRTIVVHGSYGQESPHDITQHKYGGGPDGFVECLEIKDPPPGKGGVVLYLYDDQGNGDPVIRWVFEWESVEAAERAFERVFSGVRYYHLPAELAKLPGYKGFEKFAKDKLPWFYQMELPD